MMLKTTNLQHDWAHSVSGTPNLPLNLKLWVNKAHGLAAQGISIKDSGGGRNTTATAALCLTIGAFRLLSRAEKAARTQNRGNFLEAMGKAWESCDPANKTVGIVGYERIGKRVGELLSALSSEVFHPRNPSRGP
jgi:lactate dehydrogenase-like 2-hydroxyacid dehydrogenase